MAESTIRPQDSWHSMICGICTHPFALAPTDYEGDPVPLCQSCSILVDWLGQKDDTGLAPNRQEEQQHKQVDKTNDTEKQKAELLVNLLDRWGDLWRSGEGETKRK